MISPQLPGPLQTERPSPGQGVMDGSPSVCSTLMMVTATATVTTVTTATVLSPLPPPPSPSPK